MNAILIGIVMAFSITGQALSAPRLCWYGALQTYLTCARQHKLAVYKDGEGSGQTEPLAEPAADESPTPDPSNVDADQDRGQGGYGHGELTGK